MGSGSLDLFDGPAWVEAPDASPVTARRVPGWLCAGSTLMMGIALGCLGLVLPVPGGSLIGPTAAVAGIGVTTASVGAIVLIRRGATGQSVLFAVLVLLLAGLASLWTFQFSLPAQMARDTSALSRAQQAIRQVQHGRVAAHGVPLHPCQVVRTGSIGPLVAPYRQCATSYRGASFVVYSPVGTRVRGVAYSTIGTAIFEDQCYRHLVGDWWVFNDGNPSNPGDPCAFGYTFHGGG